MLKMDEGQTNKSKEEIWSTMEFSEKLKFNGFRGFEKNELFKDNNAFMTEGKVRLKRRLMKLKEREGGS